MYVTILKLSDENGKEEGALTAMSFLIPSVFHLPISFTLNLLIQSEFQELIM